MGSHYVSVVCGCCSGIYVPIVAAFAYGKEFLFTLDMVIDRGELWDKVYICRSIYMQEVRWLSPYGVFDALVEPIVSLSLELEGGLGQVQFLRQLEGIVVIAVLGFVVDFAVALCAVPVFDCKCRLF